MDALHHLVLIKFRDGISQDIKDDFLARYQTVAQECGGKEAGILHFTVKKNLDLRKGVEFVQFALFANIDAFQAYRQHPAHQKIANDLSKVAGWWVGDYIGSVPQI